MPDPVLNVAKVAQLLNSHVFDGMYKGVHDSVEDRITKGAADEWDHFYMLIGLAGSLIVVVATAGSAAPAVAAVAAGEGGAISLTMLRLAALSNIVNTAGGALNLYGGCEQNANKPNYSPTQAIISQMKGALLKAINSAAERNADMLGQYKALAQKLLANHAHDPSWKKAFTEETMEAIDQRTQLMKAEIFNSKGFDITNEAQSRAQEACEGLFDTVADSVPKYKRFRNEAIPYLNGQVNTGKTHWVGHEPEPIFRAPTADEVKYYSRYPDFQSFLKGQSDYCVWKRKYAAALPG